MSYLDDVASSYTCRVGVSEAGVRVAAEVKAARGGCWAKFGDR